MEAAGEVEVMVLAVVEVILQAVAEVILQAVAEVTAAVDTAEAAEEGDLKVALAEGVAAFVEAVNWRAH